MYTGHYQEGVQAPHTKCVWVAAAEDRSAIRTISRPQTLLVFSKQMLSLQLMSETQKQTEQI